MLKLVILKKIKLIKNSNFLFLPESFEYLGVCAIINSSITVDSFDSCNFFDNSSCNNFNFFSCELNFSFASLYSDFFETKPFLGWGVFEVLLLIWILLTLLIASKNLSSSDPWISWNLIFNF